MRILSICDDEHLRYSRELVLLKAGHSVRSIPSNFDLAPLEIFDVALLCQSIRDRKAMEISTTLRHKNPWIRILHFRSFDQTVLNRTYDLEFEALIHPAALLEAMSKLQAEIANSLCYDSLS